ncbi:MAG: tetratricopeptide repeat protein, partial [Bacteroidota bacterium]
MNTNIPSHTEQFLFDKRGIISRAIAFGVVLFSIVYGFAQQPTLDELIRSCETLIDTHPDQVVALAQEGMSRSLTREGQIDHRFSLWLGRAYQELGKLNLAHEHLAKALTAFRHDPRLSCEIHLDLTNVYRLKGDHDAQLASSYDAYALAKELNIENLFLEAWSSIAIAYQGFSDYHTSDSIYGEMITYCNSRGFPCIAAKSNKARALYNLGKPAEALSLFLEVREKLVEQDLPHKVAHTDHHIGYILMLSELNEEALKYYHRVLDYFETNPDIEQLSIVNENLGELYLRENKPSLARKYLNEALRIKIDSDITTLGMVYCDLGRVALMEGNPREAIGHLEKALHYSLEQQHKKGEAITRITLARYYVDVAAYPDAEREANIALTIHSELGIFDQLVECYDVLINIYKATDRAAEALALQEDLNTINEELVGPNKIMRMTKNLLSETLASHHGPAAGGAAQDNSKYWLTVILLTLPIAFIFIKIRKGKKKKSSPTVEPIKPDEVSHHEQALASIMVTESLYLQSDLTMGQLASKVGISEKKLSVLLNQHLGVSFY